VEQKSNDALFLKREIARNNLSKIVKLGKINLLASFIIFILNVSSNELLDDESTLHPIFPLVLIMVFNIVCILIVKLYKFNYTKRTLKNIENAVFYYIFISLFGSAFIMIIDQDYINSGLFYTLIVFAAASFFIIKPHLFIIPVAASGVMIVITMIGNNESQAVITIQIVYMVALTIISSSLANAYNLFFIKNMRIKAELMEEIHYRKKISKDLREANRKLLIQNSIDPLTGLQNRMSFNHYLENLKKNINSSQIIVSAVMIDIDYFKKYNDFYGHAKGDDVIANVGKVIFTISEKYGIFAARYGGEEFILLLQNQTEEIVKLVCEEIIKDVAKLRIPHEFNDVDHVVTVSIGAKTVEASNAHHIMQVIDQADAMLYEVKRTGKNAYMVST
jgi:diguanylate cyclase (GGDEF)-like protein